MLAVSFVIFAFVGLSFYLDFLERRRAPRPDYPHISWMEHELGLVTRDKPCSYVACRICIEAAQMTGAWGPEGYEIHQPPPQNHSYNGIYRLAWDKQVELTNEQFYRKYDVMPPRLDIF
jgi:hypothetical protein